MIAGCSQSHPFRKNSAVGPSPLVDLNPTEQPRTNRTSVHPPHSDSDADLERRSRALASFSAGLIAEEREAPDEALRFYSQSVEADPDNESLAIDVARRYWSRLQTNRAIEVMRRTSERPSASGEAKSYLGSLYLQARRYPEAISAFKGAVALEPQNLGNYQALIPLLLKNQQSTEAARLLDRAAAQSVQDPAYWVDLGGLYGFFESSDPKFKAAAREKGLACLRKGDALKPADPVILQRLAERLNALGDSTRAEEIFRELRAKYPGNPAPTAKLAELYLRQGKIKEAKEQLESLRRNNPADPIPYYYLGLVAMEERNYSQATELLDRALFLNPEFEPAYAELAAAQMSQKQEALALTLLDQARAKFGPSFRPEFLAAMACARLKDYSQSQAHFEAAEKVAKFKQPDALDHRFYFQWGAMLEQAGKREESEQRLRKSLEIKPDFDEALNHLGYTWVESGIRLPEARRMIEQAVRLDPENPAYLDSLGWVLYKLGKPAEAVPFMEKASKLMPEPDATVEEHLGDILNAVGRTSEAVDAWRRSVRIEKSDAVQKKIDAVK